jgi:hypothetical protein
LNLVKICGIQRALRGKIRNEFSQELQRWLIALLKPTEVFLYVASLPFPTMREPRAQQAAYDPQDSSHAYAD